MNGIRAASPVGFSGTSTAVELARRAVIAAAVVLALGAMTAPGVAAQDGQSQEEQGLVTYLGVLPASMVKGHDPTHAESTMHGGSPAGQHEYHLLVAVFDAATGSRVDDAEVFATVTGLGHVGGTRVQLEPMKVADATTYGNFVNFPGADLYTIEVRVRRGGASRPVAFAFDYDHRSQ